MAMIDALMMAYTVEMISIEKVVASVKRFSTFSASKELPYDLEDAMVFWINKVKFTLKKGCLLLIVTFQIWKRVLISIFLTCALLSSFPLQMKKICFNYCFVTCYLKSNGSRVYYPLIQIIINSIGFHYYCNIF